MKVKLKTCKRRRQERIKNFPATTERRRNTAVSIPRVPSTMEGKLREIEENVVFFLRVTFLTKIVLFSVNPYRYASIGTSNSPNNNDAVLRVSDLGTFVGHPRSCPNGVARCSFNVATHSKGGFPVKNKKKRDVICCKTLSYNISRGYFT